MLIKLGPLASAVAGSIGGTTFQRGPSGTQARRIPLPTQRGFVQWYGQAVQTASTALLWRNLDPTDRQSWLDEAPLQTWTNRFGEPFTPTPYQLFQRCNMGYRSWSAVPGLAVQYPKWVGDTSAVLPAELQGTYSTGLGQLQLTSLDSFLTADAALWLRLSPPVSPGRLFPHSWAPICWSMREGDPFPQNITWALLPRAPRAPEVGYQTLAWVSLRRVDNGWPTPWTRIRITVV